MVRLRLNRALYLATVMAGAGAGAPDEPSVPASCHLSLGEGANSPGRPSTSCSVPLYFCPHPPGVSAPRTFAPFLEAGCVVLGPVVALDPLRQGSGLWNSGGDSGVSKGVGQDLAPGASGRPGGQVSGASRQRQHGPPGRRWRPPTPLKGFLEHSRSPLGSIHREASPAPCLA